MSIPQEAEIPEPELEIPEDVVVEDLRTEFREVPRVTVVTPERKAIAPPPPGRHERASSGAEGPKRGPGRPPKDDKKQTAPLRIRPPDFSEWHDYLGDFALKWAWRGYVAFVFRGIDRYSVLSEADNDALELDKEQLSDIAKPIAHLADRSKLGKRYGRVVIDSSDGISAMIQLGMAGARVNRIARKYRTGEGSGANGIAESGIAVSGGEAPEESGADIREFPGARATGFGYN